jgi:hypothetical protein
MKRNYNYRNMKRKPCKLPWLLTFVRGAIGKEYVIKHYRYGIIKTKYPDMTRIVASPGQRSCRDLFKTAVKRAQKTMDNPEQRAAWLKKVRQKHRLFNQLVKHFMLEAKKAAKKRETEGKYLIRSSFEQVNMQYTTPETGNTVAVPANRANPVLDMACRE